jgi:catechol 2,3-dioxygenase-like lactoylglutathione lyase family enzyme
MFRAVGRMVVGVPDQDEALAFYRDVLGFAVLHDEDAEGFRYLHMGIPGQPEAGIWLMPGAAEHDRPLLVLYTNELERVREELERRQIETWADTGESLHFRDVAGNILVATSSPRAG